MGRYARRKGKASSCKGIGRRGGKTKTRTKDLDEIKADLNQLNEDGFIKGTLSLDEDKPDKTFYCCECARYFQTQVILQKHRDSKIHKQRVKKLKDFPEDYGNY